MLKKIFTTCLAMIISMIAVVPAFADEGITERPVPEGAFIGESGNFAYKITNHEASEDNSPIDNAIKIIDPSQGVKFCVDEVGQATVSPTATPGMITPLTTCKGNGGVVRLESVDEYGAHELFWNVDPKLAALSYFNGEIKVYKENTSILVQTIDIWSLHPFGINYGDNVRTGLPKGSYDAYISGTCIDTNGIISWVVPNCQLNFDVY